jgi:NADH dehydrogenase
MPEPDLHVVTGAFGYSGRYIAARLLDAGHRVRTLTDSPGRPNPFEGKVEARPFDFDQPSRLVESLRGAAVLYNTYWVRFNHGTFTHAEAGLNTLMLFEAARKAGVGRVVHVSITNPSEDSPFQYFRDKALLEGALRESGLPHSILRPTVLFGPEDILINNVAWVLRRFPVFPLLGDGSYRLQPIHVDDLAGLAVAEGWKTRDVVIDAIGPETFTFRQLVETIGDAIGRRRAIVPVPPSLGYAGAWALGKLLGDILLTWPEVQGLMAGLLCTESRPAGEIKLSEWARENAGSLGARYTSELARRRDRTKAYGFQP